MRVLAGLGNPGLKFAWSRHNFGFLAIDYLASTLNQEINKESHFYLYRESKIDNSSVILIKPQTFMNNSGVALREALNDFQTTVNDLIIFHDDVDIPLGSLRIKQDGQPGGHKGLISIIDHLQSSDFIRIRLGIGPEKEQSVTLTEYVLQIFPEEEMPLVEKILDLSQKAITTILAEGLNKAMTKFNRKINNQNIVEEK